VVLALIVVAVYLAAGFRREALRAIGASLVGVGLLVLVVRRLVGEALVDSLTTSATRPAGTAVWAIGTGLLRDIAAGLALYGALLLFGAWLAGPTRAAREIRRHLAPTMCRPARVYGAVGVVFLLAILWGPTDATRRLAGVLVLGALAAIGVEALRRQTIREFPAAAVGSRSPG
jgi:hypothetical protein